MWHGDRSNKGIFQSKIRKINMKKIEPMVLNTNGCSYKQLAVQHESGRAIFTCRIGHVQNTPILTFLPLASGDRLLTCHRDVGCLPVPNLPI